MEITFDLPRIAAFLLPRQLLKKIFVEEFRFSLSQTLQVKTLFFHQELNSLLLFVPRFTRDGPRRWLLIYAVASFLLSNFLSTALWREEKGVLSDVGNQDV